MFVNNINIYENKNVFLNYRKESRIKVSFKIAYMRILMRYTLKKKILLFIYYEDILFKLTLL